MPHDDGWHGARDQYGNPQEYLAALESEDRREWQKPDEVVAALRIAKGAVACEIGGGSGYFSLRLAQAVGADGHVFAPDVSPATLAVLRDRIGREQIHNLTPVLALPGDPLLPPASCDLALLVNTFHHFPEKAEYLRCLTRALRAGGRVALIDFHEHELPVGPRPDHKLSKAAVLAHAREAGLVLEREESFLPYQYFLILRRA